MTSRAVPTLAFVLLAALATACGVESGSDAASDTSVTTTVDQPVATTEPDEPVDTTEPDAPTTTESGGTGTDGLPAGFEDEFFDQLIDGFVAAGLTQTQAECLADSYGQDILDAGEVVDDTTANMMAMTMPTLSSKGDIRTEPSSARRGDPGISSRAK